MGCRRVGCRLRTCDSESLFFWSFHRREHRLSAASMRQAMKSKPPHELERHQALRSGKPLAPSASVLHGLFWAKGTGIDLLNPCLNLWPTSSCWLSLVGFFQRKKGRRFARPTNAVPKSFPVPAHDLERTDWALVPILDFSQNRLDILGH